MSTEAAVSQSSSSFPTTSAASDPSPSKSTSSVRPSPSERPPLRASLLLSRPPVILRLPTPLEAAYHDYNHRLRRALAQPFPVDFYYKKGSAAELTFLREEAQRDAGRLGVSRVDVGHLGREGSGSLVGVDEAEKQSGGRRGGGGGASATPSAPAPSTSPGEEALYEAMPRTTEADRKNDVTSLERKLDRTLFLVVRHEGAWRLPSRLVEKRGEKGGAREDLHKAAPKAVTSLLGDEMDIWLVTHLPIGLLPEHVAGEKTFVLKAHILSGNAKPQPQQAKSSSSSSPASVEFAWLTREEIEERVRGGDGGGGEGANKAGEAYWEAIRDLLQD